MRLTDAAGSPQIETLRGRIQVLGSFIGQAIARCDLIFFKGELAVGLLAAEHLDEIFSNREGTLRILALSFPFSYARRAEAICKLAAPDAGSC